MNSLEEQQKLVDGLVEVTLVDPENFLKVKETLTRLGLSSSTKKELNQICHILHKKGRYYITHFKEMFALDGKETNFTDEDRNRRNNICRLLSDWKLITIVHPERLPETVTSLSRIKIIPFKEKSEWVLIPKYSIGRKKKVVSENVD